MNAISAQELVTEYDDEKLLLRLSREIAMDIHEIPDILKRCNVSATRWDMIRQSPRFIQLLSSQMEAWNSATNTAQRVKLKSLAFIEESLPEFFARAHDAKEALSSKVEVLKTVSKFAGVGERAPGEGGDGNKFTVTINLGGDTMKFEKSLPTRVIEHDEDAMDPAYNVELG